MLFHNVSETYCVQVMLDHGLAVFYKVLTAKQTDKGNAKAGTRLKKSCSCNVSTLVFFIILPRHLASVLF